MPLRASIPAVVVAVLVAGAVATPVDRLAVGPTVTLGLNLAAAVLGFLVVYAAWRIGRRSQ